MYKRTQLSLRGKGRKGGPRKNWLSNVTEWTVGKNMVDAEQVTVDTVDNV